MLLLAIETATHSGGVALIREDGLIAEYRLNIEVTHSERLLMMIDRVLQEARVPVETIDAVAVSIGPGSFTGLRIGLSTAKGFCMGLGKPLVPVPTLMALAARAAFSPDPVVPMLDARKKEVYWGVYRTDGGAVRCEMADAVGSPEAVLEAIPRPAVFLGEGAARYADRIRAAWGEDARWAPPSLSLPSAASVAELGMEMYRRGEGMDAVSVIPVYLRRSEAEIRRGML